MRFLLFYIAFFLFEITANAYANVDIALIMPKAGPYTIQGKELIAGVEKAVEQINSTGGLLGQKIDVLQIDDQCNDSIAVSTAQMLTILKQKKIRLVIGPYCANSFDKVADIYAKAKIFQIIPTTVNYTQAKVIKKGLIKMLGYTDQQAKDFFAFYNEHFAGQKVALIYNKDEINGSDEQKALAQEFLKHGKSVMIEQFTYDMTDKDYDKLAQKVLERGNTIAFLFGYAKNIRKMAEALKEKDDKFVIFVNKYDAADEYIKYLQDLADGTYFMELQGNTDNPEFTETLVKLRINGFDIEGMSLYGYSALNLWKTLVQQTKSFEYDKLANAANKRNIKTEIGYKMFHNGVPKNSEHYGVVLYRQGDFIKQ